MGWSIAVCPSPCHEVDAESAHRVDAQWLLVDRGATIGNDHQHSESDDHYPSSRIFLALRSRHTLPCRGRHASPTTTGTASLAGPRGSQPRQTR